MTLLIRNSVRVLEAPIVHRLANGSTIVAQHMPVEAVNLNVWLRVGSRMEADAINGMAHFLEHMVFKGTEQLALGEFERRVEARGAVTNAATSQDYTHFYLTTAPQDFATLAPLQLELVLNPSIPDRDFESERLVVLEEIRRAEDNPRRRTYYRAMETTFDYLPYRRSVLGPATVIESLVSQQMREFHHQWYQPDRLTAVVVGNLPVDELMATVTQALAATVSSAVPAAVSASPRTLSAIAASPTERKDPEPVFTEVVRRDWRDDRLQQARLVMTWRVPGLVDLAETYALDVLASILGHGRTSRLVHDLREEHKWVSSISVSNLTHWLQGVFYISVHLPSEYLEQVEAAIADHIRQLQEVPIQASEINRVRTQVANRFVFGNETPRDRATLYGYYQTLLQDLTPALAYPEYIRQLTAEDLQRAAQRYLSPTAYGIVVMRPTVETAGEPSWVARSLH
ncbi:M16 family metallopeptidase [Trichothermofontia sp.]